MSVEIEFADPDTDTGTTVVDSSIGGDGDVGDSSASASAPASNSNGTPAAFPPAKGKPGDLPKSSPPEPESQFADDDADDDDDYDATATASAKPAAGKKAAGDDAFTPELLTSAENYGFTADEARAFGSPEHLEMAMTALDRRIAAWARAEQEKTGQAADAGKTAEQTSANAATAAGSAASAPAAKPAQAPAPAANQAANADAAGLFEKFKLELDPNEYDEGTINTLNGINDHYDGLVRNLRGEVDELKSQLGMVSGRIQADEGARFGEQMDSFFDGLGDEFKEVFGKGSLSEIGAETPLAQSRFKLVEEMNALALADQKLGRKRSSTSELAKRALNMLHADKLQTIARKKVTEQVQRRNGQAIARPTGRTDKVRSPDAAAGQFASQFMRSKLGPEDGTPDEL